MRTAVRINRIAEVMMVLLTALAVSFNPLLIC
jgi:hypothetical protein